MLSSTHNQRVLDLASQKGLLRASDLDAISAPRVILTRLTAAGLLEQVGRGLYRLPDAQISEFESLATIATRVPQAVFCLLTALHRLQVETRRSGPIRLKVYGVEKTLVDCFRHRRKLGMEPVELRRRNMITRAQLPYATASGLTWDSGDFFANMEETLKLADWRGFPARRAGVGHDAARGGDLSDVKILHVYHQ